MGAYIEGIDEFSQMILGVEVNTRRRVGANMVKKAEELQELARKMAPREFGNLEEAIQINGDGKQVRDEAGRFGKIQVEVFIDDTLPVPERPGHTVGDYVYAIHENLTPRGAWQLGEESQNKQAANPSVVVGGGFMDRAADEIDAKITKNPDSLLDGED